MTKRKRFTEPETKFFASSVILGFHMHEKNMAYRDLKPENLVLDAEGFQGRGPGLAKMVEGKTFTMCGTPDYLSPEVILNEGHDKSVDYWALGVLLFEFVNGVPPFCADEPMRIFDNILSNRIKMPSHFGRHLSDIIRKFCKSKPSARLGNGRRASAPSRSTASSPASLDGPPRAQQGQDHAAHRGDVVAALDALVERSQDANERFMDLPQLRMALCGHASGFRACHANHHFTTRGDKEAVDAWFRNNAAVAATAYFLRHGKDRDDAALFVDDAKAVLEPGGWWKEAAFQHYTYRFLVEGQPWHKGVDVTLGPAGQQKFEAWSFEPRPNYVELDKPKMIPKPGSKAWILQQAILDDEARHPLFAKKESDRASPRPAWKGGGSEWAPPKVAPPPLSPRPSTRTVLRDVDPQPFGTI
ncbi:cAMP-dependent protein kinase [Aureococcus anophagefferens]|nr:cAMP-dependent protein kinase [Aureococcus anophagefferens]